MKQIKKLVSVVEAANDKCNEERKQVEATRTENLVMIGNLVHPSVPISNDEVCVMERVWLPWLYLSIMIG